MEILGLVETTYYGHILLEKFTLQRDSKSLQIFFIGGSKFRRISKDDGIRTNSLDLGNWLPEEKSLINKVPA